MKKVNFFLLFVISLLVVFPAFSQDDIDEDIEVEEITTDEIPHFKKHAIKLGLAGFASGHIFLKAERHTVKKQSVEIGAGFHYNKSLPFFNFYEDAVYDGFEKLVELDFEMKRLFLNLNYRFYFGKQYGMKGFYAAPFLSYNKHTIEGSFLNNEGHTFSSIGEINYSSFGGGIQIGSQWMIKDIVVIDWTIFGIGMGKFKLNGAYTSTDPDEDFQKRVEDATEAFEDIPMIGDDFKFSHDGNSLAVDANALSLLLRSSISIGIAF